MGNYGFSLVHHKSVPIEMGFQLTKAYLKKIPRFRNRIKWIEIVPYRCI